MSKECILEMVNSYYNGDKIVKLLEQYNINSMPSNLVKTFPAFITNEICAKCRGEMIAPLKSRSGTKIFYKEEMFCKVCGHKNGNLCICEQCLKDREEEKKIKEIKYKKSIETKKEIISKNYQGKQEEIFEEDLELEDRLYLSVLLRGGLAENATCIEPLKGIKGKIAPTESFEIEIIRTLTGKKIIVPSVDSDIDAFEVEFSSTDNQIYSLRYYIYEVIYNINITPRDLNYTAMIKRLMYPIADDFDNIFCYQLWRKVSLGECEQYLLYQMDKVGYSFNPGEKTYQVLNNLIDNFSTAQVYNIIYRAIANSTARYQSKEITKKHAQNLVITSCEKQGERAIAEGWSLKPYGRLRELPESLISEVLFNSIMKISSLGFLETPTQNL